MHTILVYGDSNSFGTPPAPDLIDRPLRFDPANRWPDVMGATLGPGFDVINASLPGRTTVYDDPIHGPTRNGRVILPATLLSHQPIDLLILNLGTNDLQHSFPARGFDIARNLEALVELARFYLPDLGILVAAPVIPTEIGTFAPYFEGAAACVGPMRDEIHSMTQRQNCGFFDVMDVVAPDPLDGVHLDAMGQRALGCAMAKAVENWFQEKD